MTFQFILFEIKLNDLLCQLVFCGIKLSLHSLQLLLQLRLALSAV